MGADPIVTAISVVSGELNGFLVRKTEKQHGTGQRIEGFCEKGAPVVIVDDVCTTGSSTIHALQVDAQHAAGNRGAVHVHVHRGEKDADLAPIARRRGGRIGRASHQHAAVGRRQHRDVGVGRRVSIGIAKEEREEAGENHKWHGAGVANGQSRCHRKGGRATDEGKTCPIDPHPAILARVNA